MLGGVACLDDGEACVVFDRAELFTAQEQELLLSGVKRVGQGAGKARPIGDEEHLTFLAGGLP